MSQSRHTNGFSPVWIIRCTFKLLSFKNLLLHSEQTSNFTPVWLLRCVCISILYLIFLSQSEHTNGSSPVFIIRCTLELFSFMKLLSCSEITTLDMLLPVLSTRFVVKPEDQQYFSMYFWLNQWGSMETWRLRGIRGGVNPPPSDKSSTGCC